MTCCSSTILKLRVDLVHRASQALWVVPPLGNELCILHMIHIVHRREWRVRPVVASLLPPSRCACLCTHLSALFYPVAGLRRTLLLPRQRQLRRRNLAPLLLQSLNRLLLLIVDYALLLKVLNPAVGTIRLKLFVELRTKCLGLLAPTLSVYAVEDVVLVQALEEAVARFIALFAVRARWGFEGAACGFLYAICGRAAGGGPREPGHGGCWGVGGETRRGARNGFEC
jgi:hypothetical protein